MLEKTGGLLINQCYLLRTESSGWGPPEMGAFHFLAGGYLTWLTLGVSTISHQTPQ